MVELLTVSISFWLNKVRDKIRLYSSCTVEVKQQCGYYFTNYLEMTSDLYLPSKTTAAPAGLHQADRWGNYPKRPQEGDTGREKMLHQTAAVAERTF